MDKLLIQNAKIINATGIIEADILIEGSKIIRIEKHLYSDDLSVKTIDAKGKYVIPGGLDPHVHLDLPTPAGNSSDDFYTGSRAALAGGTTSIIDFVTPSKGESLIKALHDRKAVASASCIDYALHMGITWWDASLAREIEYCIKHEGITSFKTYLAYKGSIGISYDELFEVMKVVAKYNGLVTVHCEDGDKVLARQIELIKEAKTSPRYHAVSRPADFEAEAVEKVLKMALETNCKVYLVHISSALSIEIIKKYRNVTVFVETCPHYLLLNEDVYQSDDFSIAKFVMSPPLRGKKDNEILWQQLTENFIDTVATDHCPFNLKGQKDAGKNNFVRIPNGAGSIEYRNSLLFTYGVLTGKISLQQWVALTSFNAAEIFGLSQSKGSIEIGKDADIVIWNPEKEQEISISNQYQRCDSNIYEGFKLKGMAETVICKGNIVFDNNKLMTDTINGEFMFREIVK
ncbi:MAG: dihydropyrimidinase [Bacteroidetes bacterium]|nr:dihydropyrimidinase [Bacteroidota bacterium]